MLVAYLLRSGTPLVRLHVNAIPCFVSDVTLADAEAVFDALGRCGGPVGGLAETLIAGRTDGRLVIAADALWTRPLGFGAGHLSAVLRPDAGTVIMKGDLNYRRALDDLSTDVLTPWADLPHGPDHDLLSLRSEKSHGWVGMDSVNWPKDVNPDHFPTDGSIFLAQTIPGRCSGCPAGHAILGGASGTGPGGRAWLTANARARQPFGPTEKRAS